MDIRDASIRNDVSCHRSCGDMLAYGAERPRETLHRGAV